MHVMQEKDRYIQIAVGIEEAEFTPAALDKGG
jgi:hypothetical protein